MSGRCEGRLFRSHVFNGPIADDTRCECGETTYGEFGGKSAGGLRELAAQATPGPWIVDRNLGNRALRADNGHFTRLAVFDIHRDTPFEVDGVANARLVALAPEMAALLADAPVVCTHRDRGDCRKVGRTKSLWCASCKWDAARDALNQKAAQ